MGCRSPLLADTGPSLVIKTSRTAPTRAQQLAIAALNHLHTVAYETMRLVTESRVMPVGGANEPPAEQCGCDFKM